MAFRVCAASMLVVFVVTCVIVRAGDLVEKSHFVEVGGLFDSCMRLFHKARKILSCGNSSPSENNWSVDPPTLSPDSPPPQPSRLPRDCFELMSNGIKTSGVYRILPEHRMFYGTDGFDVYCDMDTDGGGWTVIQRRGDYGKPEDYFYRNWTSYKTGFGDITQDFWLGNDKIHSLTSQKMYSIRFDLKDWEGETRWAVYREFWITGERCNYTLHVAGHNGNAGDSLISVHHDRMFSTFDRDNDRSYKNCAQYWQGAWWYRNCYRSNLNGLYLKGKHNKSVSSVNWNTWKGAEYSLMETEMKIRPVNVSSNITVLL